MLTSKFNQVDISNSFYELFQSQVIESKLLRVESVSKRMDRLRAIEKWIISNRESIHIALKADLGKLQDEADVSEVIPLLSEIRHIKRNLKKWVLPNEASSSVLYLGTSAKVIYEPKGTCLVISPWNYPLLLSLGPVVSALSAGNTVILKPSEYTSATGQLIKDLANELFSSEIFEVCLGAEDVSKALLQLPFNHIFFTGSPRVGKVVMEAAAKHLSSVTLELGGKSPTIVDGNSNVQQSAKKIAWGKWLNAGQTCLAPDYLFVQKEVLREFVNCLKSEIKLLYGDQSGMTRIIHEEHLKRLIAMLKDFESNSGDFIVKGEINVQEKIMGPTVMNHTKGSSSLLEEEIFGPILPIIEYGVLQEVIDTINSKPNPLAIYLFTNSKKVARRIEKETASGSLVINDCVIQFAHPGVPFGGVNNSGIGRSHGFSGFKAFSNEKGVLKQRAGRGIPYLLYPPYDRFKKTLIKLLIKYI
ncbi:aldehyde dehydrogenase family protein [Marinoscillum sp. MHG1-6]|uniref:aldehyde dehydrogenase family protein n=1 Tax=Marinoscillum sp. MHG1-6 TaxID=2959627 RepID=UPI002157F6A9|nr:aldehyde dehydrogenase family protein [Marinoscillum sp. MHG1-6]